MVGNLYTAHAGRVRRVDLYGMIGPAISDSEAEAIRARWEARAVSLADHGKDFAASLASNIADELRDCLALAAEQRRVNLPAHARSGS